MSRVTSLTNMPEEQLNRWIKRIALLFVVVLIAFVAFYVIDRFRMPTAEIVDQQLVAMEEKVRAEPENIAARGLLADTYAAKGRYEDAIVQYTLLIDADQEVELASLGPRPRLPGDGAVRRRDQGLRRRGRVRCRR